MIFEECVEALRVPQPIWKEYPVKLRELLPFLLPESLQEHDQLSDEKNHDASCICFWQLYVLRDVVKFQKWVAPPAQ